MLNVKCLFNYMYLISVFIDISKFNNDFSISSLSDINGLYSTKSHDSTELFIQIYFNIECISHKFNP